MQRNIVVTLLVLFVCLFAPTLWGQEGMSPVEGYHNRDSLVAGPGDTVAGKLNRSWLVLGAPQGSPVVAPFTAKVINFRFAYWHSFSDFLSWNIRRRTSKEQNEQLEAIANENELSQQFLNALVTLSSDQTDMLITGFKPLASLHLGDSVRKGDTIGTVDYFTPLIPQPAVAFSVSGKANSCDPFSFTGIKKPKNHRYTFFCSRKRFTIPEMQNELDIIYDLLKEVNPTLYDYRRLESFDSLYQSLRAQILVPLEHKSYVELLNQFVRFVRDPNTRLLSRPLPDSLHELYLYPVLFGVSGDSLLVTHNYLDIKQLDGESISAVDGEPASSIISFIRQQTNKTAIPYSVGGYIPELQLMTEFTRGGYIYYRWYRRNKVTHGITLSLRNGETGNYAQLPEENGYSESIPPTFASYFKKLEEDSVRLKMLAPQLAYIGLPRLDFGSLKLMEIENFLDSIAHDGCENLIVDLRYNQRGTIKNVEKLFSHLALRPFHSYLWKDVSAHVWEVQKRYGATSTHPLSPEYLYAATEDEHLLRYNNYMNKPVTPSFIPYRGNVYVLTNEFTQSLGSLFAALVHREQRGYIIGRETNSPYHVLSTAPVLRYTLPHSHFELNVPVAKVYFDTAQDAKIPYGRGVIPDIRIDYSLREFTGEASDSILTYTQELIARGGMQGRDADFNYLPYIAVGVWCGFVLMILISVTRASRRLRAIRMAWFAKHRK